MIEVINRLKELKQDAENNCPENSMDYRRGYVKAINKAINLIKHNGPQPPRPNK